MDIMSHFGETLEELSFDNKYTTKTLAESTGIDISVIRRYFRKEILPSFENAVILADVFKCSLNFLFGLNENYEKKDFLKVPPFSVSFQKILNEKHYTRYRLCKEAHISDQSADDWFHGTRIPSIENIIKLAKFFNCSIDYLIGREN